MLRPATLKKGFVVLGRHSYPRFAEGSLPIASGPLGERRDDCLINSVAAAPVGHGHVWPPGDRLAQSGVALRTVRDDEEPTHELARVQVLERVAERDALVGRVAACAPVK